MAESLFNNATPVGAQFSDGSPGITTAVTVEFAVDGQVSEVKFYAGAGISGVWTGAAWLITQGDTGFGGGGTELAEEVFPGTPTANAWNVIPISPAINVVAGELYRFGVNNGQYYWANNGFFASADVVSGNITAPQSGSSPTALGTIYNGTYALTVFPLPSPLGYPNNTGSQANYAIDITFTATGGPAEGSAALGLGLAVAATGAADHEGAAALGLGLAVAATGAADHEGAADLGLGLEVAAFGAAPHGGFAALTLDLAPAATGSRESLGTSATGLNLAVDATGSAPDIGPAEGTAALGLDLAVATSGSARHGGTAALTLTLSPSAVGERLSAGVAALGLGLALNAEGPGGRCQVVPTFPWSCGAVPAWSGECLPVPSFSEVQP